ncbi:hypothetical protein BU17DRAFT_97608 [Hysterangium stoloniferum]|nr:hypothetical protein BU17DRAFT_97608 [Hysterangium stoloniferum]
MPLVLRRSASSPSVRVAPYSFPLSSSSSSTRRRRGTSDAAHPNPRRVVSDSTCPRRVLADIEWWRVIQGQRDDMDENENENEEINVMEAENEQGDTEAVEETEDVAEREPAPPRTLESLYPLYEDTHPNAHAHDDFGYSYHSHSRETSSDSVESTPSALPSTPPYSQSIFPSVVSMPLFPSAATSLFPAASSVPPLIAFVNSALSDVGTYTAASRHAAPRSRATSLPDMVGMTIPLPSAEGPVDDLELEHTNSLDVGI